METKVQAQQLRPGDYLPATKSTVLAIFHNGLTIPSGKVELFLHTARGKRKALWSKYTEISVERKAE